MKVTESPELSHLLEYAFGEQDTHVGSSGGLKEIQGWLMALCIELQIITLQ